ncbi:hypothetical protein AB833_03515 [Chromatiales bacterium (ex Bugula neritina AB1)]|nr:hypothetical protein AB833_03515 [Chromatiales bacterium (ex Bugula neritina AB1)]
MQILSRINIQFCAFLLATTVFSSCYAADQLAQQGTGKVNLSLTIPATYNVVSRQENDICFDSRNGTFAFKLQNIDTRTISSEFYESIHRCDKSSGHRLSLHEDAASNGIIYLVVTPE